MKELERLQKEIGAAYSVMPVEQLYKINSDLTDLQKQNDELRRQLTIRDELLCKTCKGAGTVLIAPDDGIECPECAQSLSDIRAEAVMELTTSAGVFEHEYTGEMLIGVGDIKDHANRIKEG